MGLVRPPEKKESDKRALDTNLFLEYLNKNKCFDFEYKGLHGDQLIIFWKGLKYEFVFHVDWEVMNSLNDKIKDAHFKNTSSGKVELRQEIQKEELTKIIYNTGGFHNGSRETIVCPIEISTRSSEYPNLSLDKSKKVKSHKCKNWNLIATYVADTIIKEWQSEYFDPLMLDGTQWTIDIYKNDKKVFHVYGSNKWPNDFEEFENLLK